MTAATVLSAVDGPVATVTLNRPGKLNAFTVAMADELLRALEHVTAVHDVRVVVLTGAGRAFCAGADLTEFDRMREDPDADIGARLVGAAAEIHTVLRAADQLVLASLNGVAAGGGANLALGCDLRIAADTARLGQVFAKIGLHPDWGGTYFLPRLIGPARAMELFVSGELVGMPRLLDWGLVNRVVPAAELTAATAAWASELAAAPPLAVQRIKQAVYRSLDAGLDEMLRYEEHVQAELFASADFAEGIHAFRDKRQPGFTGR